MDKEKELQTIEACENIKVLEDIIKNPNIKIGDIVKKSKYLFNGYFLDLVISLNQFLINKDKTIEKTHDDLKFKNFLLDKYMEEYNKKNGEIDCDNFIEQINKIRNNIGHGKYTIDKNTLNINIFDSNEQISYNWIRSMIEYLFVNNKNKLKKLPIKTGYIDKIGKGKIDIDNINDSLSKFELYEYDLSSDEFGFNDKALSIIQSEIAKYKNRIHEMYHSVGLSKKFNRSIENCKTIGKLGNIKFAYRKFNLNNLPEELKNSLKQIINENYDRLKESSQSSLMTFFEGFINDFYFDTNDYLQIDKAFSQITTLSRLINANKDFTYKELKDNYYLIPPTDNQMLLATTLAKFNVIYSYNEDSLFRDYLDYSRLDLNNLNPSINKDNISKNIKSENNKILTLEKENNKKYKRYKELLKINKPNYHQIEVINNINLKLYDNLFEILNQKEKINNKIYGINNNILSKEKYNHNKNIINHLRNSITHGNIIIKSRIKANDISTCILTFKDFDNMDETFELTTTLDEINKICDYNIIMNDLHQNVNYSKVFSKKINGFMSLIILSLITFLELGGSLLYILLYNGVIK